MANINVSVTEPTVNVTEIVSNVTVTDVEANAIVGNIVTTQSNISVVNTQSNVVVNQAIGVSNAEIRATLTADLPITYDNITGNFGFDATTTTITALNLISSSGVTAVGNVSGNGLVVTNNATIGGAVNAASSNITGSSAIGGDLTVTGKINGELKDISLTYYDAGNVSGNVTLDVANGPVQKIRLTGNVTGISFTGASAAQPITLITQQDSLGFWQFDTSTFASNWTNWKFVSNYKTLSTAGNAYDYVSITYDGTNYFASVVNFFQSLITNGELANSNVIVNGTTIPLGSSGNISHFGNLTTTNLTEGTNLYFSAARVRGNVSAATPLTYNSSTGQFGLSGTAAITTTGTITGGTVNATANVNTVGIVATGNITGNYFLGNGALLTGLPATYGNANVANFLANGFGSNNITTTGTITAGTLSSTTLTSATANVTIASGKNLKLSGANPTIIGDSTGDPQNATIRFDSVNVVIGDDSTLDRFAVKHKTTGNTLFQVGSYISGSGSATPDADVRVFGNIYISAEDPLIDNSNAYIKRDGEVFGQYINSPGNITTSAYFIGNGSLLTGIASNAGVVSYIATQPLTIGGNLQVNGNINATGNINYQNVTDLYVRDQIIVLNANASTNADVQIIANRPTAQNAIIKWLESQNKWMFSDDAFTSNAWTLPRTTTDLAEGTNLYWTTDRANSWLPTQSTTNLPEGTNLYFTADRVRSNISVTVNPASGNGSLSYNNVSGVFTFTPADASAAGTVTQIDTGENLTGGPITATGTIGMANALANVSTITAEATKNITLNTATALVTKQKYNNVDVFSGNVTSDGYAYFNANQYTGNAVTAYSGVANIENFIFGTGNTTSGSNAITGVSLLKYFDAATPANINDVAVNSLFTVNEDSPYPFPQNTVVTSVDAANSIIYMSANATASVDLTLDLNAFFLSPVLLDTTTGQAIQVTSVFDGNGSGSKTTLASSNPLFSGKYGYPKSGFSINDFDVITAGSSSDYTLGNLQKHFLGRNKVEAPSAVFQAPRGLVVGNGDMTGRAENDGLPSFGINILWDGLANVTTDYAGNAPNTQLLLKQYQDNTGAVDLPTTFGPRLFFTSARGNRNQPYTETYPRKNDELGRITWWGSTQTLASPGTLGPPAWISGVAGQDNINNNSGLGMYFGISPNTANYNRSLYLASSMGNTLIASAQDSTGTHRPIIFAPSYVGSSQGNSVLLYNQTINGSDPNTSSVQTSGAHFAQINYNNTGALTGSKLAVTNGNNSTTQREGDLVLSIDRNYTSANANVRVRTGGTNFYGANNPDRVRFTFAPDGLVDGTAVLINNFVVSPASTLNGGVYYVKRNDSGGYIGFDLYYDSGLTSPVNVGTTNLTAGGGTFEYTRNNGVTPKDWSFVLAQGSNNLVLTEDGSTRVTFEGSNVTTIGTVNAAYFVGDGSGLTNIPITYSNANVQQYLAFGLGSNNINTTGNITAGYFLGDGSQLTSINTSQIAEGANLWYTVGRANTAIDNRVTKSFVEGLGVSYTSLTDKPTIPTHTSNLTNDSGFITTATANVISVNTKTGTVVLNTGDIAESGNLYFTTARARQSISGTGDISYDANTGVISYTGTPGDITDVIAGDGLTGGGSTGNVTLNVGAGTGITVNADNIAVNMSAFSTTDLAEGANLYYTSTRANTAIDTRVNKAFVEGLGVSYTSLTDKPTIPTHTSNLVNDSGFITSATANVVSVNGETGVVVLDTGDIAEGANLYYTTTRANSAIDARVNKAYVEALAISYTSLANTPTNVSFFTNDAGYLVAANLASLTANVDSVNGQTGVVVLDTDDIAEGTTNLYYSNARVNAFIQNNITTSDIDEGTNLYYSNTRVSTYLANYGSNTIVTTGNITAGNTIVNGVSFNTAGTTSPSSGQIVYNSNYGTHQVGLDGSNVMLMGQDLVVYARNDEANTLSKGEVVFIAGASGDKATIKRAVNNSDANSATTIGIVKSDIAAGALGYVVSQGVVDGLNLGAYTAGDKLYLGNVAGTFTNIKPSSPEHYVFIGVVEKANAGNGQILVRVQNGFELDEIHDIKLTGVQQNDVLVRNSGNTLWVNQNFGTTLTNTPITLKQFAETKVDLGTTNGNITLNMANGSIFTMTANGNISNIALANASIGSSGTLIITQDNVGSRLMTVTSAWKFAGASKTLTTTANAIDIVNFFTDGTTVYAALSKGYA